MVQGWRQAELMHNKATWFSWALDPLIGKHELKRTKFFSRFSAVFLQPVRLPNEPQELAEHSPETVS